MYNNWDDPRRGMPQTGFGPAGGMPPGWGQGGGYGGHNANWGMGKSGGNGFNSGQFGGLYQNPQMNTMTRSHTPGMERKNGMDEMMGYLPMIFGSMGG